MQKPTNLLEFLSKAISNSSIINKFRLQRRFLFRFNRIIYALI